MDAGFNTDDADRTRCRVLDDLQGQRLGASKNGSAVGRHRPQALRDAVARYNAEGVTGLYDRPLPGRPEWLSEGEQATLRAIIFPGPDPRRHGCMESHQGQVRLL
ncbi:hypothetical protein [Azospirillum argentinense]|uniref:hypothetical protein n=1 Tax=Azospirillum argentinense TaxID=2970906 RepID=UPI0032DFECC2